MVWRARGATDRITHFVVSSTQTDSDRRSAAGVSGLPRKKVTIAASNCPRYDSDPRSNPAVTSRIAMEIELLAGRKPDRVFGRYSIEAVSLPSGRISNADSDGPPLPKGFDPAMWREAARFWPGGLKTVDTNSIVADAKVARYAVLPSQMGLAQLLGSGAIERIDGSHKLRIVRPIAHLPPRMAGAHSAQLVLAKGVPAPPGDPGHSCVTDDEGRPVADNMACKIRR